MAEATRKENIAILADTNTITGSAEFQLVLAGGSANAALTLTVGGSVIMTLKAIAADTITSPCIKLGDGIVGTIALSGTGAAAYAVYEVE